MRSLLLASLAVAAGMTTARADQITYNIVPYPSLQNGFSLSGSITTDGAIGLLSPTDIVSWSFEISKDGVVDDNTGTTINGPVGLIATPTALALLRPTDFPSLLALNQPTTFQLIGAGLSDVGSDLIWYRESDFDEYYADTPNNKFGNSAEYPEDWYANQSCCLDLGGIDPWIIAGQGPVTVPNPQTVPEPEWLTTVSAVLGFYFLGAHKRNKADKGNLGEAAPRFEQII
jgi:hypothetical protein